MAAFNQTNMIFGFGEDSTLTDNHFTTTGFNPSNSAVIQMAGTYAGVGSANAVNITGNTFTGIGDFVDSNTWNGQSTLQLNLSGVQGLVQNNVFNGVDIGILVADATGNLTIDSNTFENLTRGASDIALGSFARASRSSTPTPSTARSRVSNNKFLNSNTGIRTSTDGSGSFTLNDSAVSISGNTFTGDLYDIVDKFTGTLTPAGSNVFDGVTLSAATTGDLFNIEDKIVDAVDVSGYGLVRLNANNIYVTPQSFFAPGGTTTASIQRGVDAASSGDTVDLDAGTYVGQVVAAKNLTIHGAGQATIIQSPASLPVGFISTYNGVSNYAVVYVYNAQVNIANLSVDGNGQGGFGAPTATTALSASAISMRAASSTT